MATKPAPKKAAFVLLDKAGIEKLIESISKTGKKLDNDIQHALQCCSIHAHLHGDITLLQNLCMGLNKGTRSNAVLGWIEQFAPVKFDADGSFQFFRGYEAKDGGTRAARIQRIETATHWTELRPEPKFVPFDLEAQLLRLLAAADKAGKDTEHADKHNIPAHVLAQLKSLAADIAE